MSSHEKNSNNIELMRFQSMMVTQMALIKWQTEIIRECRTPMPNPSLV